MVTVALGVTITAIAVPSASRTVDALRLSSAARDVERELQTARLKSVSNNRPMQVRLNCPAAGQFRLIEVTGVAATDTAADRCDTATFPYPGPADSDPATPGLDGPMRYVRSEITIAGPDLQFTPKGTTLRVVAGATQSMVGSPATITVTRGGNTSSVSINALGRIQLQNQ